MGSIKSQNTFAIVIHGGAGAIKKENMSPEKEKAYKEKLEEALNKGYSILKVGGSSLDAVEQAIKILEDSPLFNAGKGSVLNSKGEVECDASIMDGGTLKAGAVAGVKTVKNPISAARKVMENTSHVMLSGKGADDFAKSQKLEIVDNSYFITDERKQLLEQMKLEEKKNSQGNYIDTMTNKFGTVGAVALDQKGNIASATSTGGMSNKKYGRVGDSPIIGAGTYANNRTCGVSSTGHGEYFMRLLVAYDISVLMEYKGFSLEEAARIVVMEKLKNLGGQGGVVALDKEGNITMMLNTEGMYRGYIDKEGKLEIKIYKD